MRPFFFRHRIYLHCRYHLRFMRRPVCKTDKKTGNSIRCFLPLWRLRFILPFIGGHRQSLAFRLRYPDSPYCFQPSAAFADRTAEPADYNRQQSHCPKYKRYHHWRHRHWHQPGLWQSCPAQPYCLLPIRRIVMHGRRPLLSSVLSTEFPRFTCPSGQK